MQITEMQLTWCNLYKCSLTVTVLEGGNVHFHAESVFWQFTFPKPQPVYHCDSFVVYRQQDIRKGII